MYVCSNYPGVCTLTVPVCMQCLSLCVQQLFLYGWMNCPCMDAMIVLIFVCNNYPYMNRWMHRLSLYICNDCPCMCAAYRDSWMHQLPLYVCTDSPNICLQQLSLYEYINCPCMFATTVLYECINCPCMYAMTVPVCGQQLFYMNISTVPVYKYWLS